MRNLVRRLPKNRLRIIVTLAGSEANLATSTCGRYVRDGLLTEVVYLDGAMGSISDEELERFIAKFPIDPGRPAEAR